MVKELRLAVLEYAHQAEVTLRRASQLLSKAQTQMENTAYQLTTTLPHMLEMVEIYKDNLDLQQDLILKVVENVKKRVETSSLLKVELQYDSLLVPAADNLDIMIKRLKETATPSYLLITPSDFSTLADFISLDEMATFQKNIDIYKENSVKVVNLFFEKYEELILEPMKLIAKRYKKLIKRSEEIIPLQLELKPSNFNSHGAIGVILRGNASLEKEVLSLLEMLTNHYDQCIHGVKLIDANNHNFNFEILKNDSMELQDVFKELSVVCDMISHNEDKAEKFISSELPKLDLTIQLMNDQLQFYRDFKTKNLPIITNLLFKTEIQLLKTNLNDPDVNLTPIEQYSQILNSLSYHYSQTLKIYQSEYLQELHRQQYVYPRRFLSKISKFLTDDLIELQNEELSKRQQWIKNYGEFIPKELKSPDSLGFPIVLHIETEGLENLNEYIIDGKLEVSKDEKLLVGLIESMKKMLVK